jgi:hypothetical protein
MHAIQTLLHEFESISLDEMDRVKLMNRVDTKFAFSFRELLDFLPQLVADYFVLEINGIRTPRYESLYFDDDALSFYNDHHNGRMNRFKVRIRNYVDSSLYFLEIKHVLILAMTGYNLLKLVGIKFMVVKLSEIIKSL